MGTLFLITICVLLIWLMLVVIFGIKEAWDKCQGWRWERIREKQGKEGGIYKELWLSALADYYDLSLRYEEETGESAPELSHGFNQAQIKLMIHHGTLSKRLES
jgi:hypothetical protein